MLVTVSEEREGNHVFDLLPFLRVFRNLVLQYVLNIFLDLSKAFDTLDHTILSDKLLYYGIRGTAYNLLRSYLANREQFVELNDTASKTLHIVTGVPQGSILGPLLFLIYINDFPLSSNFFKFIMYADDTL